MLAAAYINRSYIWASQGHYTAARKQCEHALRQLEIWERATGRVEVRLKIYAHMNMGSAYRYEGDYEKAETSYRQSLSFAESVTDQESICEVTQHLGINEHLCGRLLRREVLEESACRLDEGPAPTSCRSALAEACEHQLQAWRYLTDAFEMAYETDWRSAMASTLHRLAKVYREIFRIHLLLEESDLGPAPGDLATLEGLADAYPMPLEMQYEGRLVVKEPFADLDWIGKALKLFDLSARLADEVNDLHRALDALTELARAAAERREPETLREVLGRVERLRGYDVQRELFDAMNDIARADLHLIQEEYDQALALYKDAYVRVAEKSGYADFLLLDRLRDLQWRLEELSEELALEWLRELQQAWEMQLIGNEKWPEMLTFLDNVRLHFLDA
jgi:tetratricopeptide (TPR) repeat protein